MEKIETYVARWEDGKSEEMSQDAFYELLDKAIMENWDFYTQYCDRTCQQQIIIY